MPGGFLTTRWSVVLLARREGTPHGREALERLCETYWSPVYAYVRRRGATPDDARDLTQEFFAMFLEKHSVAAADPERGRFRSFLLASVQHFLCNEWDRRRAKKRGGGKSLVSLDETTPDGHALYDPATLLTPELVFDEQWAITLVRLVIERMRDEQKLAGKGGTFEILLPLMCGRRAEAESYSEAGEALHVSPGALRVAVHRLRRRFRTLLLEQIAETVTDARQIDEEVNFLLRALGRPRERL
jgi:RNA polymerase sigma-70 factor (ECF subfamily)